MISSVLIANRGEIACRIIRTAKAMGIKTIAIYSDADFGAAHVRAADVAIRIGPANAAQSYLNGPAIIAAARQAGADAIHPAYGFLSENAGFAQDCADAGLIFIGPNPKAIAAMGLKDEAKKIAKAAGAPVLAGLWDGPQDEATLKAGAEKIGYPVLIKALAGGGGRGIRAVDDGAGFASALVAAKREAMRAFGDDRVMIEKLVRAPRHIEVQIFGDKHGNLVHLFERDCSVQRRRQKLIEEAPAPGLSEEARAALYAAALRIGRACNYDNAGTIEFIADGTGPIGPNDFWFLEMNTRLQVEHPVTEAITGLDLVAWQFMVASGEPLPLNQEAIRADGHGIEIRIVAEDPAQDFMPQSGRIWPEGAAPSPPDFRRDRGFFGGDILPDCYDSLMEKLIFHAPNRYEAIKKAQAGLLSLWPKGLINNIGFMADVLALPEFQTGVATTDLLADNGVMLAQLSARKPVHIAAAAIFLANEGFGHGNDGFGFGGVRPLRLWANEKDGQVNFEVTIAIHAIGIIAQIGGQDFLAARHHIGPISAAAQAIIAQEIALASGPDARTNFRIFARGAAILVQDGAHFHHFTRHYQTGDLLTHRPLSVDGAIVAPLPGRVISLSTTLGQIVEKGAILAVVEAMKMEHVLNAPFDAVVAEIHVAEGASVPLGAVLIRLTPVGANSAGGTKP